MIVTFYGVLCGAGLDEKDWGQQTGFIFKKEKDHDI